MSSLKCLKCMKITWFTTIVLLKIPKYPMMKIAHLYTYALLKTLLVFEHKKPKPQFANMNDFKRGAPN